MAHKYVLDTHTLVWYIEGNPRLGASAKVVIDDPGSDLILPIIALAEATYIVERGRTSIPDVPHLLRAVQADMRIEVQPLTMTVLHSSLNILIIPEMHDRLIVGAALDLQSQGHTVSILTKDSTIVGAHVLSVIW
jgi:PIN domain nuclease of toxin-antitoxin system